MFSLIGESVRTDAPPVGRCLVDSSSVYFDLVYLSYLRQCCFCLGFEKRTSKVAVPFGPLEQNRWLLSTSWLYLVVVVLVAAVATRSTAATPPRGSLDPKSWLAQGEPTICCQWALPPELRPTLEQASEPNDKNKSKRKTKEEKESQRANKPVDSCIATGTSEKERGYNNNNNNNNERISRQVNLRDAPFS